MFCTGAAPTVPGISARFSRPGQALLQRPGDEVVPVLAGAGLDDPAASASLVDDAHARAPRPSAPPACMSRVRTMLLPPPRMNFGARPSFGMVDARGARRRRWRCAPASCATRRQAEGVVAACRLTPRSIDMADCRIARTTRRRFSHAQLRCRPRTQPGRGAQRRRSDGKEIGTRFDFKGTRPRSSCKDKELTLFARQRLPDRPGARHPARPS